MPASTTKTWSWVFATCTPQHSKYFQLALCYRHGASTFFFTICSDHVLACFRFVARDPLRSFVSPKSAASPGSGCKSDLPGVCFSVTFSVTWTVSTTRDVLRKTGRAGIRYKHLKPINTSDSGGRHFCRCPLNLHFCRCFGANPWNFESWIL